MRTLHTTEADRVRAAGIARALADPKRLCIVERLGQGERSVSDLSRDVGCQVPNMSQHLSVLRSAGLVASEANLAWIPKSTVRVEGETATQLLKLLETLEDLDDVQKVDANFDMDMSEMSA